MSGKSSKSIVLAVLIAAVVGLGVNCLRFYGEQQGWLPWLFNTEGGGGGSPLGVTWLVLLFGFWFGRRLAQNGNRPKGVGRALLLHVLGLALLFGGFAASMQLTDDWRTRGIIVNIIAPIAGLLGLLAWRGAYLVNVIAGYLMRLPVILFQNMSIEQNLDTHFAKGPPGSDPADAHFLLTLAQSSMWPLGFSSIIGGLCAVVGALTVRR